MTKIDVVPENPFPVVCAWCKKVVGYSTVKESHGLCRECSKRLLEEYDNWTLEK